MFDAVGTVTGLPFCDAGWHWAGVVVCMVSCGAACAFDGCVGGCVEGGEEKIPNAMMSPLSYFFHRSKIRLITSIYVRCCVLREIMYIYFVPTSMYRN